MNELAYANALDKLQVRYDDLINASEKYTTYLEERIGEVLEEKDRLEDRLKQVVEDSELCRDRNRDLEAELHHLKVALYGCLGTADVMEIRRNVTDNDVQRWSKDLKRHIAEGLYHNR